MSTPVTGLRIAGAAVMTVAAILAVAQDRGNVAAMFAVAAILVAVSVALQWRKR